jgi:hypothetical protein
MNAAFSFLLFIFSRIALSVRFPGSQREIDLAFLDDTGSSMMSIFETDVDAMQIRGGQRLYAGIAQVTTANDVVQLPVIFLEVNIRSLANEFIGPWIATTATVYPGAWRRNAIGYEWYVDATRVLHS